MGLICRWFLGHRGIDIGFAEGAFLGRGFARHVLRPRRPPVGWVAGDAGFLVQRLNPGRFVVDDARAWSVIDGVAVLGVVKVIVIVIDVVGVDVVRPRVITLRFVGTVSVRRCSFRRLAHGALPAVRRTRRVVAVGGAL